MVKKPRSKSSVGRPLKNQRREKVSFAEVLSSANRRAHEQANRRGGKRAEEIRVGGGRGGGMRRAKGCPAEWVTRRDARGVWRWCCCPCAG